jgi:hypothetical protein
MFASVLEKIDSWLGKSFLFARFFPWLLFTAANIGLASIEFPRVRAIVMSEYDQVRAVDFLIGLILIIVVAYTVSPATQWVISLLEGRNMPWLLVAPLLLRRRYDFDRLTDRANELFLARARLPDRDVILERLGQAREAGKDYGTITDAPAVRRARNEISPLRVLRQLNRPIAVTRLRIAVEALRDALARNCADAFALKSPVTKQIIHQSKELNQLHDYMSRVLIPYATDVAQRREEYATDTQSRLYAKAELAPTRLGNDVAALRSYCDTRYGFDFDFFWPRLQLTIKDQKLVETLSVARIQVEYSALCLCLSVILTACWIVVLYCVGHTLLSLALVVIGGPALICVWFWMLHQSYSALAELIRGTIDLSRFDLLLALRRPLPETPTQERASWEELAHLLRLNEPNPAVVFNHPPSPS